MLNDASTRFKLFYANKLSKMAAASDEKEWKHVDSANNPADYCSRGLQAHEKEKWRTFHQGPAFLWEPRDKWPSQTTLTHAPVVNVMAISSRKKNESPPLLEIYKLAETADSWHAKLRRVAAFYRILSKWRTTAAARSEARRHGRPIPTLPPLSLLHLDWQMAEEKILKAVQRFHYDDEILNIKANALSTKAWKKQRADKKQLKGISSKMLALNPFIDDVGYLRVGSRLVKSDLDDATKAPVILPKGDHSVRAIIRYLHQKDMHAGPKHVLSELRKSVWIMQGGVEVRSVISKCVKCQRAFKRPPPQIMGILPSVRVTAGHPFGAVGLDMAGPFGVKMHGRATHKVWATIFTCLKTRSVHAELVHNLSADALINAISRFSARRPGSTHFISDNGTNLTAADKILKKELEVFNRTSTPDLQKRGIKWEFIPPHAPHRGGVWERVVGLFKRHLAVIALGDAVQLDTFNTALVQIEGILNRRPLTAVSPAASDCEALTPAHILYPSFASHQSCVIAPNDVERSTTDWRSDFRKAQSRVNAFWKAWSRDYLSLLHNRCKWKRQEEDLHVNTLVLVVNEQLPRSVWKMARVIKADAEVDDHVRKALIRLADGKVVLRDRTSLVRLELDGENQIQGPANEMDS